MADEEIEITIPELTPKEQLLAIAKSHPVLSEEKVTRRISRLERMTRFYQDKVPEAPEKQSQMFAGFVSALIYASTIIKMYRKLTKRLADLAEEVKKDDI